MRQILRKEVSDDDSVVEEETISSISVSDSPGAVVPAADEAPAEQEVRPWNLRTRRAATWWRWESNFRESECDSAKSPRLRGDKRDREEKEKERVVFSVPLSKKEIEEDFHGDDCAEADGCFISWFVAIRRFLLIIIRCQSCRRAERGSNASGGLLRGSNFKASFADYYGNFMNLTSAYILLFVVDQLQFRLALSLDAQWGPPFSLGSEAVVLF
ncbi:hypothetical protein NC652_027042 [Populus alba x Populus x berolinensis]|nr:hypothetical protein NC652_027042 [Populus alba x Populus x berolinensis]